MAKSSDPGSGPAKAGPGGHAMPHQQKYPVHTPAAAKGSLGAVARHGTAAEQAQVRAAVAARHPGMQQAKSPTSMGPMPAPPGTASMPWEEAMSKPKPNPVK